MGFKRVALVGMFLATHGCAFTDLKVAPPQPHTIGTLPMVGRGREITLVMPFTERRPIPWRCGMQKNGFNMDTATVHCLVPPPVWIAQSLASGLAAAGFRVNTNPAAQSPTSARIDASVLQFFVEPALGVFTFSPEADIAVHLAVTSPSGLIAERFFYWKGIETSFVGTEGNFQKAVDKASMMAVESMVQAIASLLDRFPQIGVAPALSMRVEGRTP